jgi:hypothetical protein
MIALLRRDSLQYFWLAFHALLGVAATYFPLVLIIWIYLVIGTALIDLVTKANREGTVHSFLAYYLGMEIFARAVRTSPIVPYESGKYTMLLFLVLGIIISSRRSKSALVGWTMLLLSIPGLLVERDMVDYRDIVFNYVGLLNLCLAIIYFSYVFLTRKELINIFRLCIYSIVPLLVSITLKTPDFEDVTFTLSASFDTTGGFGSNQVSTILSLGFTLIGFCYLTNQRLFNNNWVAIGLFCLFFFRGLLTFSRGGVMAGVLVLLLVFIGRMIYPIKAKIRRSTLGWTIAIFVGLFGIAVYANKLTNNLLLLRYQGETTGTLLGRKEKNISVITSGRWDVFLSDLEIWSDNFFFGVGPGMSSRIRESFLGERVVAHVEVSRLLSEHGLMGFFISVIMLMLPVVQFFRCRQNYGKLLKLCLFGLAIFTSFHSAMRTNITPFLYGLATFSVIYDFNWARLRRYLIHRKSTHPARVESYGG